jgi:hypothetical protein
VCNWLSSTCDQLIIIRGQVGRDRGAWRPMKTGRMGRRGRQRRSGGYKDGVDEGQLGSYRDQAVGGSKGVASTKVS